MRHRGSCTWGIQIGPIAACQADFVPQIVHHPDLYTGGPGLPFLIAPERRRNEAAGAEYGKKGIAQKWMTHRSF